MKTIEKVGVLMIHGIGQQARYGHLEPEVSEIARALSQHAAEQNWREPVIRARSRAPKLRGATNATWNDGKGAPIVLEVDMPDKLLELHFREVWWADLGDRSTVGALARFYAWALGMWLKPEARAKTLGGQARMRFPEVAPPSISSKLVYRLYLAVVGLIVFLPIPLAIIMRVLRIGVPPLAKLLAEYLGDVKLYQDQQRVGPVRIEDLGLPPRVSIRARMIQALVDMALGEYSRWYVCAHSLGSVIAFNGLMETEQALPNYLDDYTRERARQGGLLVKASPDGRKLNPEEQHRMCPPRPAILETDDIIDRSRLFAGLRGLLTYGCPLERFRLLWPAIVPINREAERDPAAPAFSRMTWVNLLDPSDPVASRLVSFGPAAGSNESHPAPLNIPYRCSWPQLGSHISYLRLRKGPCAVRCLGEWLLNGSEKADAEALWSPIALGSISTWMRELIEFAGWLVLLAAGLSVTATFIAFSKAQLSGPFMRPAWLALSGLQDSAVTVLGGGVGLMILSGFVLYFVQKRDKPPAASDVSGGQSNGPGPSSLPGTAPDLAE